MSIQVAPNGRIARTPPGPSMTSVSSCVPGSIVISAPAPAAAAAASPPHRAPQAETSVSRPGRTSPAVTAYPARTRFAHIGIPIRPTPTKLTFTWFTLYLPGGDPADAPAR